MGYIEKNLVPGEEVLYKTRLHWIVLAWPLIGGVVLVGIGFVFVVGGYEASGKGSSYTGMIIAGLLLLLGAAILIGPRIVCEHRLSPRHVLEFDRDPDAPAFKIGTKVSRIGAAAQVLEEQRPVFIPDTSQEMMKHPELAPFFEQFLQPQTSKFANRTIRGANFSFFFNRLQTAISLPPFWETDLEGGQE